MRQAHVTGLRSRAGVAALGVALVFGLLSGGTFAQQKSGARLSKLITTLEAGRRAMGKIGDVPADIERYDWMFIDMEHGPYSMERLQTMLAQVAKGGRPAATPIVRVPAEADEDFKWQVKQVMDNGSLGVIVSHVESKEQALKVVRSARYPPLRGAKYLEPVGVRGMGPGGAVKYWGPQYVERADLWPLNPSGDLFVLLIIESVEGVRNVADILSVPGVSGIFIGPSDLGMSLGVGTGPATERERAYETVGQVCTAKKAICGALIVGGDAEYKKRVEQGYRMFLGVDPDKR